MLNFDIPLTNGQKMGGYIAAPEGMSDVDKLPCVIVIQEIFGVNEGLRGKCDWLAREGFIAVAPDLFHQFEAGIELSDQKEDELQQAFDYFGKFNIEQGVEDIRATYEALKNHPNSNGKIGTMGYCLGGKLAYLSACQISIDASVGYYGVGIEELLAQANNIEGQLMLHLAEEDGFVPKEAQAKIKSGLADNDNVTCHSYAGVDHAFTREGGDAYDAQSASIADRRTIEFLKTHLNA